MKNETSVTENIKKANHIHTTYKYEAEIMAIRSHYNKERIDVNDI